MPNHSRHQKKIIQRYYEHRDDIALARLAEIVSELYLVESDRKRDQLWKRVEQAMTAMKVPPATMARILKRREPETLARYIREWSNQPPKPK